MGSNMSAWWEISIIIWDLAKSGWPRDLTGWRVFMAGKEDIRIGGTTPLAMIVLEKTPTDVCNRGATTNKGNLLNIWQKYSA